MDTFDFEREESLTRALRLGLRWGGGGGGSKLPGRVFHILHIGICLANTNTKMNKTSQLKDGNQLMGLWQSIELVDLENVSGGGGAGLRQAGHRALA